MPWMPTAKPPCTAQPTRICRRWCSSSPTKARKSKSGIERTNGVGLRCASRKDTGPEISNLRLKPLLRCIASCARPESRRKPTRSRLLPKPARTIPRPGRKSLRARPGTTRHDIASSPQRFDIKKERLDLGVGDHALVAGHAGVRFVEAADHFGRRFLDRFTDVGFIGHRFA